MYGIICVEEICVKYSVLSVKCCVLGLQAAKEHNTQHLTHNTMLLFPLLL